MKNIQTTEVTLFNEKKDRKTSYFIITTENMKQSLIIVRKLCFENLGTSYMHNFSIVIILSTI